MFFSSANKEIVLSLLQLSGKRNHPSCMTQAPFQRADKYIQSSIRFHPETLVFIPSLLTIEAILFSSGRGTFPSSPPSGVSLETV